MDASPPRLTARRKMQIWVSQNQDWLIDELDGLWSKAPRLVAIPVERAISATLRARGPAWWRKSLDLEELPAFLIAALENESDERVDQVLEIVGGIVDYLRRDVWTPEERMVRAGHDGEAKAGQAEAAH